MGGLILTVRSVTDSYQNERYNMPELLERVMKAHAESRLENIACFYGLGNHGLSRRDQPFLLTFFSGSAEAFQAIGLLGLLVGFCADGSAPNIKQKVNECLAVLGVRLLQGVSQDHCRVHRVAAGAIVNLVTAAGARGSD
jgi:hypothetical protein